MFAEYGTELREVDPLSRVKGVPAGVRGRRRHGLVAISLTYSNTSHELAIVGPYAGSLPASDLCFNFQILPQNLPQSDQSSFYYVIISVSYLRMRRLQQLRKASTAENFNLDTVWKVGRRILNCMQRVFNEQSP